MMMIFNGIVITSRTFKRNGGLYAPHDNFARYFIACQYLIGIIFPILFILFVDFLAILFVLAILLLNLFVYKFALLGPSVLLVGFFMGIALIYFTLTFFAMPIQSIFGRTIDVEFRPRFVFLASGASLW